MFSLIFHGQFFFSIFALPFVAKKPLELLPIVSVELIQISEKTNIPYALRLQKLLKRQKMKIESCFLNKLLKGIKN